MEDNNDISVIDLTNSLNNLNKKAMITNTVIVISDEDTPKKPQPSIIKRKTVAPRRRASSTHNDKEKSTIAETGRSSSVYLGECAICWEDLGTRRICSTKCGHVYCLKCLEMQLKFSRQCPSCRCPLSKNCYHPLYIGGPD